MEKEVEIVRIEPEKNLPASSNLEIRQFEESLLNFLARNGLPNTSVLVPINQRITVFRNIPDALAQLEEDRKSQSLYISKFIAAVASGLFDAALNYLWDETINELRNRVAQYDLSYFYDNAVTSQEKRKRLKDENDLEKIDDSELIHGAKEIGLISELGFKHLDFIRYMRNWASAAHPNQNEITGLQLIGWLETCINEVISLPLSNITIEIKKLLVNIKANAITEEEAKQIATFFITLTQEQANTLAQGLFGIYTRQDTLPQTRENIHRLLPVLWDFVDEPTKQMFGVRYGKFVANNDQEEQAFARGFLEIVGGQSYIPDSLRSAEIETAIENLLTAHRGINNFYSEPPFARELSRLVGQTGNVPAQINKKYVLALVEVFLTNANGIAWNAEPIYLELIRQFDSTQALMAVLSFNERVISSRLQFSLCQRKYRELLEILRVKLTSSAAIELVDEIKGYSGPYDKMKDDTSFKRKAATLQKIMG
ncbi:hypothetical protein P4479_24195 [Brevibacillus agri]|uniref:hypothetical protein n=1 Tax=Brevibacillus agri TaxID=51101 RepID=UPI002E1B398A|nr:hypothetical protein [Brevibacillus agri]